MSTTKPERIRNYASAAKTIADIEASIQRTRALRASRFQARADDLLTGADRDEARTALRGYYTDRDEE